MLCPRNLAPGRVSRLWFRPATRRKPSAPRIGSLMRQDYPGAWTIILVDDDSSDGTAEVARRAAAAAPGAAA